MCLSNTLSGWLSICLFVSVRLFIDPSICWYVNWSIFLSVCPFVHLFVRPSVYLSKCLSVHPSVCPSICLSAYRSVCPSILPSVNTYVMLCNGFDQLICLSVSASIYLCLSICLLFCRAVHSFICLSIHRSVHSSLCSFFTILWNGFDQLIFLSLCPFFSMSANPSICLSIFSSICQSFCLSVYPSVRLSFYLSIPTIVINFFNAQKWSNRNNEFRPLTRHCPCCTDVLAKLTVLADPSVVVGVEGLVGLVDDDFRRPVAEVGKQKLLEFRFRQPVVVILLQNFFFLRGQTL
jgi:hypothetical protein